MTAKPGGGRKTAILLAGLSIPSRLAPGTLVSDRG